MSRLSTFLSIFLLITTTSVVLTYAQKVEPTIDPEPINLQYKAMLYRLDFKTIPSISPAMRSVLLLTTLYYIIVFQIITNLFELDPPFHYPTNMVDRNLTHL